MAKTYSIAAARQNFPSLVDEVVAGEHVEITRRGKPVVVVLSQAEYDQLRGNRPSFMELHRRFMEKHPDFEGLPEGYWDDIRDPDPDGGRPPVDFL